MSDNEFHGQFDAPGKGGAQYLHGEFVGGEAPFSAPQPGFSGAGEGFEHGFGGDHDMQTFGFTLANGQVMAMNAVFGTLTFPLNLPANATFSVDASSGVITETLTGATVAETRVFTPETNNTSLYQISQDTITFLNPSTTTASGLIKGYAFTFSSGQVSALQEVFSGTTFSFTENEPVSPTTVFSASGATVTESTLQGHIVETITFMQPSGSTLYAVASESSTIILPGSATTLLSVNPHDRANFTIGTGGGVTQIQAISANGVITTIIPPANESFSQISPGFVQETITTGTNGHYVLFYQGSSSAPYTEIAHGAGTTVDLVGIQAQLAQIPANLLPLL